MSRRPKNKKPYKPIALKSVSPNIKAFPVSLSREISTPEQKDGFEDIIVYGEGNNLPLRIAQAVDDSPSAKSCVETIAQFIKGSGFSDPELQKVKIDKSGTTLWDFHCALADSLALYRGFAANFKFDADTNKIKIAYPASFESCRFKQPPEGEKEITEIVYNPYFGTNLYRIDYSQTYPVFNIDNVGKQISSLAAKDRKKYGGQIYYYGKTSPLQRFYPIPDYWSAKKWIYIDGKIQESHANNMDNGFFQSVMMTVIGDPNEWSQNPRTQKEVEDSTGQKRLEPTKTVGEEFSDQMSQTFSGSQKQGNVYVQWAANKDQLPIVDSFPTNAGADLFLALQDITTKNITIATRVPSILANISEGVSLGSGGSEIQKAIELMQSRTAEYRTILENFYNEVLLPNFITKTKGEVKIVNFNPITEKVEIEDKFWDVLSPEEKRLFIKKNFPGIELVEQEVTPPAPGSEELEYEETDPLAPKPAQPNEALKNINMQQLNRIQKIVGRYNIGLVEPENKTALTYEQAKALLLSYGLTESDIPNWLVNPNES